MAIINITVSPDPQWSPGDELLLCIGSEGAADLASSTPAGGREFNRQKVIDGLTISATYQPTDKCALLPVGVKVRDAAGNVSAVAETIVQLQDVPEGPSNLRVSQDTPGSGIAQLAWDASPDLN